MQLRIQRREGVFTENQMHAQTMNGSANHQTYKEGHISATAKTEIILLLVIVAVIQIYYFFT